MSSSKIILSIFLIAAFLSPYTFSHDSWLVPDDFTIEPGKTLNIFAKTGMDFPESLNSINLKRIKSFLILGSAGKIEAGNMKIVGKSTIISCNTFKSGTYIAAMALKPNMIKLSAKAFNEYLISDGMNKVWELRKKEGILEKDAVEFYSKYPKTIFQVGKKTDNSCLKAVGLAVEILPLKNPYTLKKGDDLRVRVVFRGKPLVGAELSWSYPGNGETFAGTKITGKDGEAVVPLEKSGPYVLRLTHIEWVKKKTHEWESFWASLTFSVPK